VRLIKNFTEQIALYTPKQSGSLYLLCEPTLCIMPMDFLHYIIDVNSFHAKKGKFQLLHERHTKKRYVKLHFIFFEQLLPFLYPKLRTLAMFMIREVKKKAEKSAS
jgi:hypothetical protein